MQTLTDLMPEKNDLKSGKSANLIKCMEQFFILN